MIGQFRLGPGSVTAAVGVNNDNSATSFSVWHAIASLEFVARTVAET
jgi:hypothetical protein